MCIRTSAQNSEFVSESAFHAFKRDATTAQSLRRIRSKGDTRLISFLAARL
jgi:hypothetical protein